MDDLSAYATHGHRILAKVAGALSDDGRPGLLLVLDPPTQGPARLGEGPSRIVLLLLRDEAGALHEAARNDKIVPSAQQGGLAGDPFGYAHIESGRFRIVNGGGSREHWTNEYHFRYSSQLLCWQLERVVWSVVDRETGSERRRELTATDLGAVTFQDFDPANLPEIELLSV